MRTRLLPGRRRRSVSRTSLVVGGLLGLAAPAAVPAVTARAGVTCPTPPAKGPSTVVLSLGGRAYNPSDVGYPVTFDVTVGQGLCDLVPTGTVSFKDTLGGGSQMAIGVTAPVVAGRASESFDLPVGTHDIVAFYSGDTTYSASDSSTAPYVQNVQTVSQWWVTQVYRDALGRDPEAAGESFWVGALGHLSRTEVAYDLLTSPEGRRFQVVGAYEEAFARQPDGAGLAAYTGFLEAGGRDETLTALLFASQEGFDGSAPPGTATNLTWVDLLYTALLQRAPDAGGRQHWIDELTGGASRTTVAEGFTFSLERARLLLAGVSGNSGFYELAFHRNADIPGRDFYAGLLVHGWTDEQVYATLLGAPEYLGRNNNVV